MAAYTYADEKARKQAAGIPLNNGKVTPPKLSVVGKAPSPVTSPVTKPVVGAPTVVSTVPKVTPTAAYGGNVTGYTPSTGNTVQKQLADYGQQWHTAAPGQRGEIHNQAMALGTANGGKFDSGTGKWTFQPPQATPVPTTQSSPAPAADATQQPQYTTQGGPQYTPPTYTPNNPTAPNAAPPGSTPFDPAAYEKTAIENEIRAYQERQKAALDAANAGVNTNKAYLEEQIGKLNTAKNQNDLTIQETENRFGGVYSGGMRLGQAANLKSTNEAIGGVTRDVAARNQQPRAGKPCARYRWA